jgi:hypothetical protein
VSGTSRHLRGPAVLVVLIAIVGLGAASAMAALAAVSAAKPFELVFNGGYEFDIEGAVLLSGAFTSKTPFCESGSAFDELPEGGPLRRRFACADGSGSVTLSLLPTTLEGEGDWSIVDAIGEYAGLRGRGTFQGEAWEGPAFRSTFQGFVAADAVAPTITLPSLKASKVNGTKSIYTIPVALDIRDDVEDNPVTYKVIVTRESGTGPWLASKSGEAIGDVTFEFRVRRPNARVRAVLVQTTAVDPVGNESSLDVRVRLPR